MLTMRRFASFRGLLADFARDKRGISAVEFAMLLPLMMTLYLGGVEVSQAVSADRKVSLTARAVGDLVAQGSNISNSEMTNILNAAKAVTAPFPVSGLKVRISSVKIDANKKATVEWSDALNDTPYSKDKVVTVPNGLLIASTYLVWAEVEYKYTPVIGYVITGSVKLTDKIYMRPRLQDKVCREGVNVCS